MLTAFHHARRLSIGGSFAAPTAGPDKTALAGRVGIVVALAAINPCWTTAVDSL